ncbi:MAG TPA: sugar ABC transporter permease [Acidimicrobiales bacterium]|nr:sugar ABC transporter permease [Acidimicrobiales bacterium]
MSQAAEPVIAEQVDDETERSAAADRGGRGSPGRRAGLSDRARAERSLAWKLCAPAVVVMVAVTGYPIAYAVWLSLQRYDLRFPAERGFVGLQNYVDVLTAELWWQDVVATVIITVVTVALELTVGMALALVMHRAVFGRQTVRASILIPYGIVTVVAAFAWQFAFTPDLGFVNEWLGTDRAWLTERGTSFLVITLTEVWKTTPFMALLLLAGLAVVPDTLQQAAKVDGANAWQRFVKVTLPNMKAAVLVALLFRTLDAFRIFDSVFIQTQGANGTETLSILGYNQLINRLNLGVGSAVSVLIFLAVILIALLFVRGFNTDLGQARGER